MNTWSKKNNRVVGEKGSPQNRLRYELYSEGFGRIDKGLKEGNHFEVVSIVFNTVFVIGVPGPKIFETPFSCKNL